MSEADGRVRHIEYHEISSFVGLCFIKGLVVPQTRVNEKPYLVWVLIFKNTGTIHKADCHCIAGLSGMCKHVAALLYRVSDMVKAGLNKPGTCHQQMWHHPSSKLIKSAFLSDISTPKAASSMNV